MEVIGLKLPLIKEGDDLVQIIFDSLNDVPLSLEDGDVLVITEKIVAKSQGRLVELDSVTPKEKAVSLAKKTGKDPRIVELILQESRDVLKVGSNFIITETNDGFICANAGIDSSNVEEGKVKLLPHDPDKTAKIMQSVFEKVSKKKLGVVIADSFGRPFRSGSVGVALGVAGVTALWDRRGESDLYGRTLESTRVAVADCIASAANLVMGDASERIPVTIVRGLNLLGTGSGRDIVRDCDQDIFRPR